MVRRMIKLVLVVAVLAVVIDSLPDLKRYLEIRGMLNVAGKAGC